MFCMNFKEGVKICGSVQKVQHCSHCNFMCLLIPYLEDESQFCNIWFLLQLYPHLSLYLDMKYDIINNRYLYLSLYI